MMGLWFRRAVMFGTGWYLTMAYPLDDSAASLAKSIAVGTLGVIVVALTAYWWGRADA